jgi:hypothetical protein
MKKFLFLFSFLAGSTYVQAQDMFIGPKAGFNVANTWNAKGAVSGGSIGVQMGAVANYKINDHYAVQTEFLYSQKGYVLSENQAKIQLNYLDMPLLFNYNFVPGKSTKYYIRKLRGNFYAVAGPQLSVLLSGKVSMAQVPDYDLKSYAKPFDLSVVAGGGYKFHNGITIGANYAMGVRHIGGIFNEFVPVSARNSVIQGSVSYLLPIMLPKPKLKGTEKTKLKTQKMLWY